MNGKIRVGLLIDSFQMPGWIVEMIKRISATPEVEIVLVIVNGTKSISYRTRSPWSYKLFASIDKKLYKASPHADKLTDLSPLIEGIPNLTVPCIVSEKKKEVSKRDIDLISTYNTDVLIKLGFERLGGDIFNVPKFGVWSMDLYKERPETFTPPSLQFFNNNDITPSTVKLLTSDPASEKVLYQSFSMTDKRSLSRNFNKVYWKSLSFIPRLLALLAENGEEWFCDHVDEKNKNPAIEGLVPKEKLTNRKIIKTLFTKGWKGMLRKIRKRNDYGHWDLFYHIGEPDHIETSQSSFVKIPCPPRSFRADPHPVTFEGRTFIFFEEWDHKKSKGHIAALEFKEDQTMPTAIKVLEKPYHLSYPFVFEWAGILYMVPETAENKTIELYRCTTFPNEWVFVMNLMDDLHAVDTTLFYDNNKWWLFVNIVENRGAPSLDELFIFYADDFLTTEWKAHRLNPVVSDCRKARPAGALFTIHKKIYRPSQCSDRTYGSSTNINEVKMLTEETFLESRVATLAPVEGGHYLGIHSYGKLGGLTVIDQFYQNEYNKDTN